MQSCQLLMALKSVYIDSFYNPTTFLPKATLTSVPNPTQYNVRRRNWQCQGVWGEHQSH